jgi:hypothetical protein
MAKDIVEMSAAGGGFDVLVGMGRAGQQFGRGKDWTLRILIVIRDDVK